ncbi:MAG: N-acetylmuramoyl-L-alanine amidase, partial [Christensenellaceae bacterium]
WEPHIYVSMHHNASPTNSAARGVEVYYNTPFSMPLARNLTNSIYQAYLKFPYSDGAKNRGHKFSEFAVTRQKQFASVLIENGFITNAQEREVLKDPNNLYTFAWYTAEGLESYFEGN